MVLTAVGKTLVSVVTVVAIHFEAHGARLPSDTHVSTAASRAILAIQITIAWRAQPDRVIRRIGVAHIHI